MKCCTQICISAVLSILMLANACGKTPDRQPVESRVLMQYGDSVLTLDDVVARIPVGISEADSALMFDAIVNDWLESMLLGDMASRNNIDMRRIDRLVTNYRNQLIIAQYRDRMMRSHASNVSESQLRSYYNAHKSEMILEQPVVKGVFLKVKTDASRIEDLRQWMSKCNSEDIDNIEKYGIEQLLDYEYFIDSWLDWTTLTEQFFGRVPDPEQILKEGGFFSETHDGIEQMLYIKDIVEAGKTMPYDFAQTQIADILTEGRNKNYETKLIEGLYNKALDNKRLKINDSSLARRLSSTMNVTKK